MTILNFVVVKAILNFVVIKTILNFVVLDVVNFPVLLMINDDSELFLQHHC